MRWTIVKSSESLEAAKKQARGTYQRDFLSGYENLSGSSLKGKAKRYGYHYQVSRQNLLRRLRENGIPVSEQIGSNNSRLLVIG